MAVFWAVWGVTLGAVGVMAANTYRQRKTEQRER